MAARNRQSEEDALADQYLDTASLAREVSTLALQQALKEAMAGTLRDPGKTAVAAITTSGIALDKRLILEGRPTQISAAIDPSETLNALARKLGLTHVVESTAIPDAEVIETPETPALPLPAESDAAKRAHPGN